MTRVPTEGAHDQLPVVAPSVGLATTLRYHRAEGRGAYSEHDTS